MDDKGAFNLGVVDVKAANMLLHHVIALKKLVRLSSKKQVMTRMKLENDRQNWNARMSNAKEKWKFEAFV